MRGTKKDTRIEKWLDTNGAVFNNTIFVSNKNGNDDNDGLTRYRPVKTIRKGVELCSSNYLVEVLDNDTYDLEDSILIIPSDVTINARFNMLLGQIKLSNRSKIFLDRHLPNADGQTMVECISDYRSLYSVNCMSSIGYKNIIHFKPSSLNGIIIIDTITIFVGSSTSGDKNILLYSNPGSSGVNIATDPAKFSADKNPTYGTPADLVYGDTGYCQWTTSPVWPCSITYNIGTGTTVTSYKMKATSSGTRMPKDWTFYGKDGANDWVLLDTRSSITWVGYEEKEFSISSPDSYDQYKITVTASTHLTVMQIDDIALLVGYESIGGEIEIISRILELGEYADGIQICDDNQLVYSNIDVVRQIGTTGNATFVIANCALGTGEVNHRGNIVDVATVWNKTGGVITWNTARDIGTKTGSADHYTVKNTDL